MTLVRRVGTVIILESSVYFPMLYLDRPRAHGLVCFQTHAGFRKLTGERHLTQNELREFFREHRKNIERLANTLYEAQSMLD
jgi:hypothetical protein